MLSFLCATCRSPCRLREVHAWVHTHATCSPECAAGALAAAAGEEPNPAEHVQRAGEALAAAGGHAGHAMDAADSGAAAAAVLASAGSNPPRGLMGGLLRGAEELRLEAQLDAARSELQTQVWQLARHLTAGIEQLMGLHGLGFPVLESLGPLQRGFVVLSGNLDVIDFAHASDELAILDQMVRDVARDVAGLRGEVGLG